MFLIHCFSWYLDLKLGARLNNHVDMLGCLENIKPYIEGKNLKMKNV
jgi:hypothetical protein